jgi:DNA-binding response OmpR family regulator
MTLPLYAEGLCRISGRTKRLTRLETEILAVLLVAHPDRWTTIDDLIEAVWPDPDTQPLTANRDLGVYIWRLRRYGVGIETRFSHGRTPSRFNGYRIPREARSGDQAAASRRAA